MWMAIVITMWIVNDQDQTWLLRAPPSFHVCARRITDIPLLLLIWTFVSYHLSSDSAMPSLIEHYVTELSGGERNRLKPLVCSGFIWGIVFTLFTCKGDAEGARWHSPWRKLLMKSDKASTGSDREWLLPWKTQDLKEMDSLKFQG